MTSPRIFRAPGRVNLIGEHTDYNLGFVLPIALDLATTVETVPSHDRHLHVWSEHRGEERSFPVDAIFALQPGGDWSDYVLGVAQQLARAGFPIEPLSLTIRSDVPEGAGLSSSAALEVSVALALLQGRELPRIETAKLCRRAEAEFVGLPCGIMDQFIALFGEANAAVKIDCRSLERQTVPLPAGAAIVAVNSMVKHSLAASAYRVRVEECAAAVAAIQRMDPAVRSLRDATLAHLAAAAMPENALRRARHIVTENERVELFAAAAEAADPEAMGRLFSESHRSMRDDYEITCEEIDFLVDAARSVPGCFGARMTGGGFGGCTVNLVAPDSVELFRATLRDRYRARYGIDPAVFVCVPGPAAGEKFL